MTEIPDFNDTELWTVRNTLKERYGEEIPLDQVDTEMRMSPGARDLTPCPALYWEHQEAHFVVAKTGEQAYRGQFFYRLHQMFGTGVEQYEDLGDCVVALLQVQADHEAARSGENS